MNEIKAKEQGYTHHARMYGFIGYACPYHEEHDTCIAKWWVTDRIVEVLIYIEQFVPFYDGGFKILLGAKL